MAKNHRTGENEKSFVMKTDNGNLLTDPQEIGKLWRNYFKILLMTNTIETNDDQSGHEIVEDDVVSAGHNLVFGKMVNVRYSFLIKKYVFSMLSARYVI